MTRFIMSLEEAVDLVLYAFENGENGDLLIMKAPACSIGLQAEAVTEMFGGKKEDIKVIGICCSPRKIRKTQKCGITRN